MQAALYANGKVVTGVTHGHAFSCLTASEKDTCVSGRYDELKKKFVCEDDRFFYMKDITFVRHAHANGDYLTVRGIKQITTSVKHMAGFWEPNAFVLSSPAKRCQHTASLIQTYFGCSGYVEDNLAENVSDEQILACLDAMPSPVIAVTHSDFIRRAIFLVCGTLINYLPNLSVLKVSGSHLDNVSVFYEDDDC